MALEIEGKIIKLLPEQTGEGRNGPWKKQDFVVETFGEYPKKVCFSTWGEKAEQIKQFSIGQTVKVSFRAESREYNERWYTDLRAWKIENPAAAQNAPQANTNQAQSFNAPPPPEPPSQEEEEADDLPF